MQDTGIQFPPWNALRGESADSAMTLPEYWSMDKHVTPTDDDGGRYGHVMTLVELLEWINRPVV